MASPTESARRRALSSIILVSASTLIDGILGAARRSGSDSGALAGASTCAACFASWGGLSSFGVDAGGAAAGVAPEAGFAEGTIWLATPGFTTLAGGPAGAEA